LTKYDLREYATNENGFLEKEGAEHENFFQGALCSGGHDLYEPQLRIWHPHHNIFIASCKSECCCEVETMNAFLLAFLVNAFVIGGMCRVKSMEKH